jgi:hypothetical protein
MTSASEHSSDGQPRAQIVRSLNDAIDRLVGAGEIANARCGLETAIGNGNVADIARRAESLTEDLQTVLALVDTADELDPHLLPEEELFTDRKWKWLPKRRKKPNELVVDAIKTGQFRERRFALQVAEANTNRRIAWLAIAAILVNACATVGAQLIK